MLKKISAAAGSTLAYALLASLLFVLLSLRYFSLGGWSMDSLGTPFGILALLGQFAVVALAVFLLLQTVRCVREKLYFITAPILTTFFFCLLTIDIFVFSQYRSHLSPALITLFVSPAGLELFTPTLSMIITAAGAVVLFAAISLGSLFFVEKIFRKKRIWNISLSILFVLSLLISHGIHAWANFVNYTPVLIRAEAIPGGQMLTSNKLLRKMGVEGVSRFSINETKNSALQYPLSPLRFASKNTSNPNILFLFLDSWRADSLTPEVMPNLRKRSRQAIVFQNHFSGGNATRAGIFSAFYGIPPKYWHSVLASGQEPVLMDTMAKNGYEFFISASAYLGNPEFDRTVFSSVRNLRTSSDGENTLERDADAANDFFEMLDKRNSQKPFFGFLFYDAPHAYASPANGKHPFRPAAENIDYFKLNNESDPTPIRNMYSNCLYNLDIALESFFAECEKRGLLENTIIIVTGDHGQEINDTRRNRWGHNSNFSKYQTQVPMLIFRPDKKPATHAHRTSHLDIVPTLMTDVFGCQNPVTDYGSGKNLFDDTERKCIYMGSYSTNAILTKEGIFTFGKYGLSEGYNLDHSEEGVPAPLETIKEALHEMARFYKN